jgi:hypothetical protein
MHSADGVKTVVRGVGKAMMMATPFCISAGYMTEGPAKKRKISLPKVNEKKKNQMS